MPKEVSFGAKPQNKPDLETWVETREISNSEQITQLTSITPTPLQPESPQEELDQPKMKRLTLDIPDTLHRKIKGKAVLEGVTMVEMLRNLLDITYG